MTGCQIVLVEDNPADVYLFRLALEENDITCEITTFGSGLEALKVLCPANGPATNGLIPDAIFLDLNTPKSDGFEVLIRIKNSPHLAQVPIAILTSSQATSDKARAAALSTQYIQKPSQLNDFIATVGRAAKEMLHSNQTAEPRPASSESQ